MTVKELIEMKHLEETDIQIVRFNRIIFDSLYEADIHRYLRSQVLDYKEGRGKVVIKI